MSLAFPVTPRTKTNRTPALGTPDRATHCVCDRGPVVADPEFPTCINCGRFPRRTINETWLARASHVHHG